MKSAPAPFIALLNSGQPLYFADLYTFTLVSGTIKRFTTWDTDLTYGGNTYSCSGPALERGRTRTVLGVEVDTLDLNIWPKAADQVDSMSWLAAAASGALDGMQVRLDRVAMSSPPVVVGGYINFTGRWSDFTLSRTEIRGTVRSDLELLNTQLPRNLYQAGCQHTLYDADCGLDRNAWKILGIVATATPTSIITSLSQAAGYFDQGYIQFITGALAGTRRSVKSYLPGAFSLLNPLPLVPGTGDTFYAYPGCAKTQAVCTSKFSNLANFRGFPYIPQPETAR